MQFLHESDAKGEWTYQDVFIVPNRSDVKSRTGVDVTPQGLPGLTLPIMVANMMGAAGKRMTETVARRGGMVCLPQDYSMDRIRAIVQEIHACHPTFETPVTLNQHRSVQTALNLIYKRSHGAVVVTDDSGKPVGIFTQGLAKGVDKHVPLEQVMETRLVTCPDHMRPEDIFRVLERERLQVMPIINAEGVLRGVMTKKGCVRDRFYKPALNHHGQFMTSVAVGIHGNIEERIQQLLEIGIDLIVLDTAHGHQEAMLDAIRRARAVMGANRPLAAGNIVTAEAAEDFIDAGASILKVGVGPGAMCTTRMATGVGRPQFSAVKAVADVARKRGAYVIADGGIKHPRDLALALAAGAHFGFIGSWFAATYESPGDIQFDNEGRPYKSNFGMASGSAVRNRHRDSDPYVRAQKMFFKEGISSSRMYLKPGEESAEDVLDALTAGLRSACTYVGAQNLEAYYQKVVVGTQQSSGYAEGRPVHERW